MYTNKAALKNKRSYLRKNQTKAELVLWQKIKSKKLEVKFRRQYSIENFIVDFYCHDLKLIIELDGYIHSEEEKIRKDKVRQQFLESLGYKVLRYRNEQIKYELDNVLQNLWNYIQKFSRDI